MFFHREDICNLTANFSKDIRILIVDDEELIRWSLQAALSGTNHTVDLAGSGEEALKMLKDSEYDIIITDLKMPGLDGLELMARIREKGINARVILISAFLSDGAMKQAAEYGAFKCVNKPFGIEDFLGVVKEAVEAGS